MQGRYTVEGRCVEAAFDAGLVTSDMTQERFEARLGRVDGAGERCRNQTQISRSQAGDFTSSAQLSSAQLSSAQRILARGGTSRRRAREDDIAGNMI
jgi:hypothetical protein